MFQFDGNSKQCFKCDVFYIQIFKKEKKKTEKWTNKLSLFYLNVFG